MKCTLFVTGDSGPLFPSPVTTASPHPETSTKTTSHSYPVVAGLRALVRSSMELDINQANSILQQYLAHLSSYYNVTVRITSIKKV
ncbi:hypothetical protein PDJAM_G00206240 [Pangasius djambal]|uniref:Uncharacterized protein n=1 Tax=Pangasius djambal TaxID=1691987 RepID=A0ACC5Y8E6_9TELE|nr:hypothetical protein [Pangasius djambal]